MESNLVEIMGGGINNDEAMDESEYDPKAAEEESGADSGCEAMETDSPQESSTNVISKSLPTDPPVHIEEWKKDTPKVAGEQNMDKEQDGGIVSPKPSSTVADMLCDLSHRAMGEPGRFLLCLSLAASKSRISWLNDLDNQGYAGLLYVDMTSMKAQAGYSLSWWFENRKIIKRRLVKTPLEETAAAGIFTAKEALPGASIINSVMCTIAELVGSNKSDKYIVTTAQMCLPSSRGFSQDFRHEEAHSEVTSESFRCFWYFGPTESDKAHKSFLAAVPEREAVFIGSAGQSTKVYGTDRVVTLEGFFGEADRKFRLHFGDILIMRSSYPFALDLPVGGRAKGARVLSWLILPEKKDTQFPVVMPISEILMSIDMITSTCKDALDYRNQEFDQLEINPGPPGDPDGHMQRFRVTPRKYGSSEIMEEVENNEEIRYINSEFFNDEDE